jgi:hypothetical protein
MNNDKQDKVATDYYYAGMRRALEEAGIKVANYGEYGGGYGDYIESYDSPEYSMGAGPSRRRSAKAIPAPQEPEVAEMPDFEPLWRNFAVSEFADLPENYQFDANADPNEVQRYIDAGNQYIGQVQQIYTYLLKQGLDAKNAAMQAKKLVARNFQRYQLA